MAAPIGDCPECVAGKHQACNGIAWNFPDDRAAECPCAVGGHRQAIEAAIDASYRERIGE